MAYIMRELRHRANLLSSLSSPPQILDENGKGRNADILVCQQFRRYTSFDPGPRQYHEGVAFFSGGKRIENFPEAALHELHDEASGNGAQFQANGAGL
jgi:hypothetical protein